MNKILIGVNVVLVVAVGYLFYKVSSNSPSADSDVAEEKSGSVEKTHDTTKKTSVVNSVATPPTGKIAFVNIDVINEESAEVNDLVAEAKRKKAEIENSVERLSMEYQSKVEEYQQSAKAGIRPQAEMEALAKKIQDIEREAQNKQLQMDNLSMNINDKNAAFQEGLKSFLVRWNNGRYDFILTYSDAIPTMLLGNASLDVTKEVITKVNEEYKAKKTPVKK